MAGECAGKAYQQVKEGISQGTVATKDAAVGVKDATIELAKEGAEKIKEGAVLAKDKAIELKDAVVDKAKKATGMASEEVDATKDDAAAGWFKGKQEGRECASVPAKD
jgi:hypothetical protein